MSAAISHAALESREVAMPQANVLERPYERAFARSCGFASLEELLETSEPVRAVDGELWFLAPLPDGHWMAWPYPDLDASHQFVTHEESLEFLKPSALLS